MSAIGLGVMQFGSQGWGWGSEFGIEDARHIVHRALDLGINFFDTAELYGGGRSEEILAEALGERRDEAVIATKVSPHHLTRKGVRQAALRSLRRLGTRQIDLFQVHWPNPLFPESWPMRGMGDLLDEGIIGQVGVSNYSVGRWRRAEELLGRAVASNQVSYHLLSRGPLQELLPYARDHQRLIIAYSPLAQGLLTGKYSVQNPPGGMRTLRPLFSTPNLRRVGPVLETLGSVANAHGATPAQIALAWLLHGPGVIAIPAAKSVQQLESNAAAADISLSDDEWERLRVVAEGFHRAWLLRRAPGLIARLVRIRSRRRRL